ncbi:HEAT repeat domain-containing protein [Cuniculiplasma sp. SKW4]|uniref:HEAT repeat domain-containing protein n=1 Tax=Cuniculiplasma sp. SKW4 TaxID=3400171 RepID=UPI003FD63C1B
MKNESKNNDIETVCEFALKELKRMLKKRDVSTITKNSIKYLIPICENTLANIDNRKTGLENSMIILRGILSMGNLSAKSKEFFEAYKSKFEAEAKNMNRDLRIEEIARLLESGNREDTLKGIKDLADYSVDGFRESMAPFIFTAISFLSDENIEVRRNAAKFIFYASSYKESVYIENRPEILEGLKNSDPDVRAIIAMTSAKVKDLESIDALVNLQTDHSMADFGILSIPDYMIKFPHNGAKARINDIVTDSMYEIINSKKDQSLYITKSIRRSIRGDLTSGKGASLVVEIVPIVDLPGLVMDLTNLKGSFDVIGETTMTFDLLKAGEMRIIETGLIPERTGHLKGYINCTTSNGWSGSIPVEVVVEEEIPKQNVSEETKKQKNENVKTGRGTSEKTGSSALDTLISEIESGKTSKVVNALEELKRYVPNDKSLNDKISALSITISLRGVEKVSKSEMDNAIELVRNVKRRIE